jgi:subtilase family serine protease
VPDSGVLAGSIPNQEIELAPPKEVGMDYVTAMGNRVVVGHGAIPVPTPNPSDEFIEPTTGKLPDLSFLPGSLQLHPSSPRSGETIFISARVQNTGQASAESIRIRGYHNTGENAPAILHAEVGRRVTQIPILNPGGIQTVQMRWDPTDNAGKHELLLKVDPDGLIEESSETNNSATAAVTVRQKADLVVNASEVQIKPVNDGKNYELQFEVQNQGESHAERITIQLAVTLAGSEKEHTIFIPKVISLAPGKTYRAGGIRIPASLQTLKIMVDPDEIVDEESHDNNIFTYEASG